MKALSGFFMALAVALATAMGFVTGYYYCDFKWGIEYRGYSAPADTAFLYALPFLAGIALCAALAIVCRRKARR